VIVEALSLVAGMVIETDLVVVGAGPGALALALQFLGTSTRVAVLETGGLAEDALANATSNLDSASRYGGENRIENTRRLGGNANVWSIQTSQGHRNVRFATYTEGDFAERAWMPESGWPIGYADYSDAMRRARITTGLPEAGFSAAEWADNEATPFALNGAQVQTSIFQFANGEAYLADARARLEAAPNITIYPHAHAVELMTRPDGARIEAVRALADPGHELTFKANRFVLAGGGLACPQILLNSTTHTPNGVGNAHDTVGRWFMDHPLIDGGDLVPADKSVFDRNTLYDLRTVRGTPVMGFLAPTDRAMAENPIVNLNLILFPVEADYRRNRDLSDRQALAFYSSVRVRDALRNRQRPLLRDLFAATIGADGIVKHVLDQKKHPKFNLGRGGWSELDSRSSRFDVFEVLHVAEQAPHRDNRVSLGNERDRYGQRRVKIDWTFTEEDNAAIMRSQDFVAGELRHAGLGEWRIARDNGKPVIKSASTGHFLGATRMSTDPREGVVDPNCRVHGVENLWIASSSVFPTGGFANPTLSICAFGIRIADALKAA
jgi:choline dehydrogenase-like flavoprotein